MNAYTCSFDGRWDKNIVAETASKARYKYYESLELCESYAEVFKILKSKLKHKFEISDLFGCVDQFNSVKSYRGIEFAYMGMKVRLNDKVGFICGANSSCNLQVCFEGNYHTSNCHPYYKLVYINKRGMIIKDFREKPKTEASKSE